MAPELVPVVDEGLGNTSWLVGLRDGLALVVDASRDLRAVRAAVQARGWTVAYAAETHLHADFVTGAVDLAAGGAELLASLAGGRAYGHRGLRDGDEVDLGGLTLRALGTPGHTDEHLSYLLVDGDCPVGVFTGGSLVVGAGRRPQQHDRPGEGDQSAAGNRRRGRLRRPTGWQPGHIPGVLPATGRGQPARTGAAAGRRRAAAADRRTASRAARRRRGTN